MIFLPVRNQQGFTLIEALIAMMVLTIGILVVAAMQGTSIRANSTAIVRTEGNAVALSFMEMLQTMPYNATVLSDGNGANAGDAGLDDAVTAADYSVVSADFQSGGPFASLGNVYTGIDDATHTLIDKRGRKFQVYWNISNHGTATVGQTKVIRLHVRWNGAMGLNSTVVTSMKYMNISL